MTREEYAEYLQSQRWAWTRGRAIHMAQGRCQNSACRTQGDDPERHRVEVHHLTYDHVGSEWPGDLIVLCADCHRQRHGLAQRPEEPTRLAAIVRSVEEQLAILRGDKLDPDSAA